MAESGRVTEFVKKCIAWSEQPMAELLMGYELGGLVADGVEICVPAAEERRKLSANGGVYLLAYPVEAELVEGSVKRIPLSNLLSELLSDPDLSGIAIPLTESCDGDSDGQTYCGVITQEMAGAAI